MLLLLMMLVTPELATLVGGAELPIRNTWFNDSCSFLISDKLSLFPAVSSDLACTYPCKLRPVCSLAKFELLPSTGSYRVKLPERATGLL